MENNILPDFQKFLLSRGFAPPKNVPFYANWVRKFIANVPKSPLDYLYNKKQP
jgi:hypothetical protein